MFRCLRVQSRVLLYETPWLCCRNQVYIVQSFLEARVSAVQLLMYPKHVVEYRAFFSPPLLFLLVLGIRQRRVFAIVICAVKTYYNFGKLLVDSWQCKEREWLRQQRLLQKAQENCLEKLDEGVQYPVRVQPVSVWEVQVSRLNTDTYHTWILRLYCCRSVSLKYMLHLPTVYGHLRSYTKS